jgi:hypothetical protein
VSNSGTPPRFVPTLTEVVEAGPKALPAQSPPVDLGQLEAEVIHRVLQRVDLSLERRIREAVGRVILAHTQSLGPELRDEIEVVVRECVSQAVAQELPRPAAGN